MLNKRLALEAGLLANRRDAGRRSSDATHAALSEALGRFSASGEWDGATPTASADSLGRSGPPAWAEDAADGSADVNDVLGFRVQRGVTLRQTTWRQWYGSLGVRRCAGQLGHYNIITATTATF